MEWAQRSELIALRGFEPENLEKLGESKPQCQALPGWPTPWDYFNCRFDAYVYFFYPLQ